MKQYTYLLLSIVLSVSMNGISFASPQDIDAVPKPIKITTGPYVLAALDKIQLTMSDESRQTLQVSQDGNVSIDDKDYHVMGISPDEAAQLVRRHLSGIASISFDEFRQNRVSVLGEVFHQIYTDIGDGPMRVLDAIAAANGFTPLANTRRVKLVRENAGRIEIYELDLRDTMRGKLTNQNLLVKPGDVITVPRNFL